MNRTLLRNIVIYVFVIGLCAGLLFQTKEAYARVSLSELQARIEALETENAVQQGYIKIMKGTIIMWSGEIDEASGHPIVEGYLDENWHICDGSAQGIPDLRDRFVIGAGLNQPHETGGEDTIQLGIDNLPAHHHLVDGQVEASGNHRHYFSYRYSRGNYSWGSLYISKLKDESPGTSGQYTQNAGSHTHNLSLTSGDTGEGLPLSHLPPFYSLTFLIYIGE